jgi:hypothetical protein
MNNDEPELCLIAYVHASSTARYILRHLKGMNLTSMDIQRALCEQLQIDECDAVQLLDKNLSADEIVALLRDFEFSRYHPEILAELLLVETLLPPNVPRLLTGKTVKVKGEVWRIHKNDADPFPSVPHAHNYESGVTLHLGTGELFDRNRKTIGNIGKKPLQTLRAKLEGLQLPALEI